MTCPICGAASDPVAFYCRGCYYLLVDDQDDEGARPEQGLRIIALAEACEMVDGGHWTLPQFQAFLESFADDQRNHEQAYRELPVPQGLEEDFEEEQDLMFDGVKYCNQGVETLSRYGSAGDGRAVLGRGLGQYWRGVQMVKEAMATNRRNVDRPVWF